MNLQAVTFEKQGHTAVITLNRPDRLNAVNSRMSDDLFAVFSEVKKNPDIWVAILTGAGEKAFSAGADLREGLENPDLGIDMLNAKNPRPQGGFLKNFTMWKPIIAAVNGVAMGGGLEMAMACDIRIAADHARFAMPEVKWSLIPAAGGVTRLPRFVPRAIAMRMILVGEPITAQQALQWGLVSDVVPAKELLPLAHSLAEKMCGSAPLALQAAKEAVLKGLDQNLEMALAHEDVYVQRLMKTEDFIDGITAFSEKRKPNFKGK